MIVKSDQPSGLRPFSRGYGVSLAFALVGIVFLAVGAGGTLKLRSGADPLDAINEWGLSALLFVWLLGYLFRFIFWRRVSERTQGRVRVFVTAVFLGECFVAIVVLALFLQTASLSQTRGALGEPLGSIVVGALCQIATVTWLVRYRRE